MLKVLPCVDVCCSLSPLHSQFQHYSYCSLHSTSLHCTFIPSSRSFEAWVLSTGWSAYASGAESPLFSWAPRTGGVCASATVGLGYDPAIGAGGHTSCDNHFGSGAGTASVPGHGFSLTGE